MSKENGKCDCAAFGPDECVCGAWDDAQRSTTEIRKAVNASCKCRPDIPVICPACNVWSILYPETTAGVLMAMKSEPKYPLNNDTEKKCAKTRPIFNKIQIPTSYAEYLLLPEKDKRILMQLSKNIQ